MKDYYNSGICDLNDLSDLIKDILNCIETSKTINDNISLENHIYIKSLGVSYEDGKYNTHISYKIQERDEEDETNISKEIV